MQDQEPPDTSGYAVRSMYLMSNDGFVTIGYWYSTKGGGGRWEDTGGVNVTSQVTHWMRLPDAPVSSEQEN